MAKRASEGLLHNFAQSCFCHAAEVATPSSASLRWPVTSHPRPSNPHQGTCERLLQGLGQPRP
eukprot:6463727-Alexandrium_andersonii.AAC.1